LGLHHTPSRIYEMQRKHPPIAEPAGAGYTTHATIVAGSTDPGYHPQTLQHRQGLPFGSRPTKLGRQIDTCYWNTATLREKPSRSRSISQPAIATTSTSITLHEPREHPRPHQTSHDRQSIVAFTRSDHDRLKRSTVQPASPWQPPSQVSGSHLPARGTPQIQERPTNDSHINRCQQGVCVFQTYATATGYLEQSRRRAITHSETLYHDPRLWDRATVYCLVRRRAWPGSTQQAASLMRPPASI